MSLTGQVMDSSSIGSIHLNHLRVSRDLSSPVINNINTTSATTTTIGLFLQRVQPQLARDIVQPYMQQKWRLMRDNWLTFGGIRAQVQDFAKQCRRRLQRLDSRRQQLFRDPLMRDLRQLEWYLQLFAGFDNAVNEHAQLQHYEEEHAQILGARGGSRAGGGGGITNWVRIPSIQLKPEYEWYHALVGRPRSKTRYNEDIIHAIKEVLNSREYALLESAKDRKAHVFLQIRELISDSESGSGSGSGSESELREILY